MGVAIAKICHHEEGRGLLKDNKYNFFIIFCTNMPFYSIVLCCVIDCFCWQTVRFRER